MHHDTMSKEVCTKHFVTCINCVAETLLYIKVEEMGWMWNDI